MGNPEAPSGLATATMTAADVRLRYTHKSGVSALFENRKVFLVALFASYVFEPVTRPLAFLIRACRFGGLEYGYQQGVISQALVMTSFKKDFPRIVGSSGLTGWLTSILQLGGWFGALSAGVFAEVFSRRHTIFAGSLWVILGSFLTAGAHNGSYLYAGRFFTGLGVGTLSAVGYVANSIPFRPGFVAHSADPFIMQNSPPQRCVVFLSLCNSCLRLSES